MISSTVADSLTPSSVYSALPAQCKHATCCMRFELRTICASHPDTCTAGRAFLVAHRTEAQCVAPHIHIVNAALCCQDSTDSNPRLTCEFTIRFASMFRMFEHIGSHQRPRGCTASPPMAHGIFVCCSFFHSARASRYACASPKSFACVGTTDVFVMVQLEGSAPFLGLADSPLRLAL